MFSTALTLEGNILQGLEGNILQGLEGSRNSPSPNINFTLGTKRKSALDNRIWIGCLRGITNGCKYGGC